MSENKIKTKIKNKLKNLKNTLFKKFEQYKLFFDKKLNTTITIWIIWLLLLSTWAIFYSSKIKLKSNVLESNNNINHNINKLPQDLLISKQTIIIIWWEKYLLKLEKLETKQNLTQNLEY